VTDDETAAAVAEAGGKVRKSRRTVTKDGFSEGAWKSLAVKSLRVGWPEGLRQAQLRLGKSKTSYQLVCGMFEDVFPATDELAAARQEVKDADYDSLCSRETHHGRGYSDAFCDLADEACAAPPMYEKLREIELWIPRRANNTFYTWVKLEPVDSGVRRSIDETPWTGMPVWVLDAHTPEGRRSKSGYTPLSGDYDTHRAIGQRVMAEGWGPLRSEMHADVVHHDEQLDL
jgi:hypothetical protein